MVGKPERQQRGLRRPTCAPIISKKRWQQAGAFETRIEVVFGPRIAAGTGAVMSQRPSDYFCLSAGFLRFLIMGKTGAG